MSLEQDGFLSPELDAQAARAMQEFAPKLVDFVRDVNRFGLTVFLAPRPGETRDFALVAAALLGRAIQDFEAAVLLASRGLRAQSRSLVRSGFETAMHCTAAAGDLVLKDGAKIKPKKDEPATTRFIDALDGAHQRYRVQVAKGLQKVSPTPLGEHNKLSELVEQLAEAGPHQDIILSGLAADLGLSDLYETLYRRLSQDAHPSATALEHHVEAGAAGELRSIRMGPDYSEFGDTLLLASCALLVGLLGYVHHLGTPDEIERCTALKATHQKLDHTFNRGSAS